MKPIWRNRCFMPWKRAFVPLSITQADWRENPAFFEEIATRSKGPRGPGVGYGSHRTIYLTGIDAYAKVARAPRADSSGLP
jgi:hypothetical protein